MNKIAFIADIHSNITALKAVIEDIEKKEINQIVCLGDMIGKGPSPDLVVDILKNKCISIVLGNLETSIVDVETKIHGIWNREKLGLRRTKYIKSLNYKGSIMFAGKKITYFHTISNDNYLMQVERVYESDSISVKRKLLEVDLKADIIIYADIHRQYKQDIGDKIIINVGSIGNKLTDLNEEINAEYVILQENSNKEIEVKFIKVPYDKEKEIEIVNNSDMPHKEKYISEITTGKYVKLE